VEVPRRPGRPARVATLELRWEEVEIKPPEASVKKTWPARKLYAVMAREVGVSGKVEPIEWVLLTDWPVKSLKMARRMVRWYALRWGIECWHKVLKVVCGVERRQLKSAQGLERALALDMIVASRVLLASRLGKEHPELPAELVYSPEELEVLEVVRKKNAIEKVEPSQPTQPSQPNQKLTILQANILVAQLAGFWGRKSDGHPGAKILAEGMQQLHVMVWFKKLLDKPVRRSRRRGGT
jgi:Transposase Tn5 dimerisation domain